jgi:hypothetical protein
LFINLFSGNPLGEFSSTLGFLPCVIPDLSSLIYLVTRDEHKSIIEFIERTVNGVQPPMDIEADAIIRALFKRNPDAAYRITMLAMSLSGPPPSARPADMPRHKGWLGGLFDNKREVLPVRLEPVIS